jgi:hypothetical protein
MAIRDKINSSADADVDHADFEGRNQPEESSSLSQACLTIRMACCQKNAQRYGENFSRMYNAKRTSFMLCAPKFARRGA